MESCAGKSNRYLRVSRRLKQFIEAPALQVTAKGTARSRPRSLLIGQQLGSYQILSLLGAGGMGEVCRDAGYAV